MSEKKPRESRKPLNQSFLDFVHGDGPDVNVVVNSETDEEQANTPLLQQQFAELMQRLSQIETAIAPVLTGQSAAGRTDQRSPSDLERIESLELKLNQCVQHLQAIEQQTKTQLTEFQAQLVHLTPNPKLDHARLDHLETQVTDLTEQLNAMNITTANPQPIPLDLPARLEHLEQTLQQRWEQEINYFNQVTQHLTELTQTVGQLRREVNDIREALQQDRPKELVFTAPQNLPTHTSTTELQPHRSEPISHPSVDETVNHEGAVHVTTPDSLLNRLSSFLDDF
jgi:DNA repair exonuclease SbcCD ATPase subunit